MKIADFGSFRVPFHTKYMKAIVIGISTIKHQIRKGRSVTAAKQQSLYYIFASHV